MNIGIGLPNTVPGTPGQLIVEWARRAELRGFSTLGTIDRVAYPSYESLIALAAAAGATERIGLFTDILLAPARNPVLLAKQAASLDQLSRGRFTLGMAVGGRDDDFVASGQSFNDRGKRFDAMLEIMHDAWRGELVAGARKPVGPRPVNERVPIMFGGMVEQSIRRVVRWGLGWTAGGGAPDMVGPFAERVRAAWREAGREGEPRIVTLSYYSLGDTEDDSVANLLDYYAFTGDFAVRIAHAAPRTPEALRETIKGFEDVGVGEVIFFPTVPSIEQVDLLADAAL